jgi:hypothetical protein
MQLTLRRFDDVIRQEMTTGTMERPDGSVLGVAMTQRLGKDQQLELSGTVADGFLQMKVTGPMQLERKIPWDEETIGLYRELRLPREKKIKPGDSFSYLRYEPGINAVVRAQVKVKDFEEVDVGGRKEKLLRVETQADKIMDVQLPMAILWMDKDYEVIRTQTEMPGLGQLVTLRSTREAALKPVTPAQISDVGLTQLIHLNRKAPAIHDARNAIYRITLAEDDHPDTAFAIDDRQATQNSRGKSFELNVHSLREPREIKDAKPAREEFLKSNYFINSDDEKVRELAQAAVGAETVPWKKALRIERWVHEHMKSTNFTEAMATADHVARTLEGDCTEYAMLAAAMCRAVGVPSRTALGLVYAEINKEKVRGPVLAYHMWTEVYVEGQWLALDATLGRGGVGVGHLKITDHSWHEQRSMAPLLPVMRVLLAKPSIELVQVDGR